MVHQYAHIGFLDALNYLRSDTVAATGLGQVRDPADVVWCVRLPRVAVVTPFFLPVGEY